MKIAKRPRDIGMSVRFREGVHTRRSPSGHPRMLIGVT
jgi:hypothetical protein